MERWLYCASWSTTILVVALVVAGGLLLAARVLSSKMRLSQLLCWWAAKYLAKILWSPNNPGKFPRPEGTGAIIICNHRSSIDPVFVQTAIEERIHYMVAREFCEHIAFRGFLRICEAIPVNRGGVDTRSTKEAIRRAKEGNMIGMFPEGRINMTDDLFLPVRPGAVLVALKARVPIIPCYIEGSPYNKTPWSPLFMRAKVIIRFGQPIDLTEYYEREREDGVVGQVMLDCMRAVAALGGHDDFEPTLAGRKWLPKADKEQIAREHDDAAAEGTEGTDSEPDS